MYSGYPNVFAGDFFLVVVMMILVCLGIAVLYVVSLRKGQKAAQPGNLLIAALGLGQMVTVVQQLTVIQQFKIEQLGQMLSMLLILSIASSPSFCIGERTKRKRDKKVLRVKACVQKSIDWPRIKLNRLNVKSATMLRQAALALVRNFNL